MKSIIILLALISLIRVPFNYANLSLPFVSFLASCTYLLPLNTSLHYFKKDLIKIKIVNESKKLVKKLIKKLILIIPMKFYGPTIKTRGFLYKFFDNIIIIKILPYKFFILFILMYFIIIKSGKENNIPYFIRYHTIHSLLIFILQFPVIYFHKKLLNILTLSQFLKITIKNLALTIITLNLSFIFYAILMSVMGHYVNIPILTESGKKHVGKNTKI
jgi:hypothetical protein